MIVAILDPQSPLHATSREDVGSNLYGILDLFAFVDGLLFFIKR